MENSVRFGDVYLPLLVSNDGKTRVCIGDNVFQFVETAKGNQICQPLSLAGGKVGTLIFKEDWTELVRFPDGSTRLRTGDTLAGIMQTVARACGVSITTPHAPKIVGKREQEYADEVGRAKTDCMAFNERYDRINRTALVGKVFDRPGQARKRYGQPDPMYVI